MVSDLVFSQFALLGLAGANAGKFTGAMLAQNYTFWSLYFLLRQA